MILEKPVLPLMVLETYVTSTWIAWTSSANSISIQRGGKRNGPAATVDVGTLTATLINAGDPLAGSVLKPNLPVRVTVLGDTIFTGRINDLDTSYSLDKSTGVMTTYVTLSATDAVSSHVLNTRYGAVTAGGLLQESWASRIIRLATSSTTTVNPPADDSPIVRYGI